MIRPKQHANGLFGFRLGFNQYSAGMMLRIILLVLTLASPAVADDLLPIGDAVDTVAARYQGRMIAAEVTEDDDREVYDFRWLTPQGNVLRIRLDGITGQFLLIEGVGQTEARILP